MFITIYPTLLLWNKILIRKVNWNSLVDSKCSRITHFFFVHFFLPQGQSNLSTNKNSTQINCYLGRSLNIIWAEFLVFINTRHSWSLHCPLNKNILWFKKKKNHRSALASISKECTSNILICCFNSNLTFGTWKI